MKNHNKRGLLASAGALLTAAALALSGAAAAHAAPPNPPANTNVVITKVKTPAGTLTNANGTQQSVTGGLGGATFQLTLIDGSAAGGATSTLTNAGLLAAQGRSLDASGNVVGGTLSATTQNLGPTDTTTGATPSTAVPAGQYLVREINVPAGQTASAPFLLTLPLTNPAGASAGTDWLSTVYVYPKAANITASKTVDEGTARVVGENIEWEILSDSPQIGANLLTSFVITDTLDSKLTLVGDPVVRFVDDTIHGDHPLVKDTDYTVTSPSGVLTITFLASGLRALETVGTATPTTQLSVKLTTTVAATAGSGTITNSATVSQTSGGTTTTVPTTPVSIVYGDLVVEKLGVEGSTETKLNGAKFKLYRNAADANAGANAISVNGVSEWTTANVGGNDGRIVIPGLLRSDFVDGALTTTADDFVSFYLVETQAPAGHQLVPGPIEVQVVLDGGNAKVWQVKDVKTSGGFVLPLTGGMGTAVLTIGGIAILAIVLLVARRRREEASAE